MTITTRIVAAGAFLAATGTGSASAESGVCTGRVSTNNGTLSVRVSAVEGNRTVTRYRRFEHGVDTEVMLGDQRIRATELERNWMVRVTWKQDPDPSAVRAEADGASADPPAGVVNRNPMVAERIEVVADSRSAVFAGFEGSGQAKLAFPLPPKPSRSGKPAPKRWRTVMAKLHVRARYFLGAEEVEKRALNGRDGQGVQAEVIDDGATVPTIFRLTFKE